MHGSTKSSYFSPVGTFNSLPLPSSEHVTVPLLGTFAVPAICCPRDRWNTSCCLSNLRRRRHGHATAFVYRASCHQTLAGRNCIIKHFSVPFRMCRLLNPLVLFLIFTTCSQLPLLGFPFQILLDRFSISAQILIASAIPTPSSRQNASTSSSEIHQRLTACFLLCPSEKVMSSLTLVILKYFFCLLYQFLMLVCKMWSDVINPDSYLRKNKKTVATARCITDVTSGQHERGESARHTFRSIATEGATQ